MNPFTQLWFHIRRLAGLPKWWWYNFQWRRLERECPKCWGHGVLECEHDAITGGDPGYPCPFCNGEGWQQWRLGWKPVKPSRGHGT